MKLINNRYRVIEQLNESEEVSIYLCSDIWNEDKLIKINIVQKGIMTDKLKSYYVEKFIGLNNMNHENIIKNASFGIVTEIDNRTDIEEQYIYTSEYIKDPISLLEYIKDKNTFETIDVCIDICRAIHYLHVNGYIYGAITFKNIFFSKTKDDYELKLKDIATVKVEEAMSKQSDMEKQSLEMFKSRGIDFTERRFDMHSLGMLFISMITGGECEKSPSGVLEKFKEYLMENDLENISNKEKDFLLKIFPILSKLFSMDKVYPYRYIYEFIDEINGAVGSDYSVVDLEKLQKINIYSKLINRDSSIEIIKEAYSDMMEYRVSKNIFFIEGNSGIGKTRLLKELDFLLKLEGADVYSTFKLTDLDGDLEVLEEIFNKMILYWDRHETSKLQSEVKSTDPDEVDFKSIGFKKAFNDAGIKEKLLEKMSEFILDTLKVKQSVIIIDNINLATEFTIDIIKYIYSEIIKDKNTILIFSYKDDKIKENKKVNEFISGLRRRNESISFKLDNFNEEETGEMIRSILSMGHVPKTLTKKVYGKSYGNPLFITEIMKELYSSKTIFREEESGLWHIEVEKGDTEYKGLEIPNNIEQALLNQLKDITTDEENILNTISISFDPINLEDLQELTGIERDDLERGIEQLINRGILGRIFIKRKDAYDINNRVLSDIIYDKISEDLKVKTHRMDAELLEDRMRDGIKIELNMLIYHLERSLQSGKAKRYLIQNSEEKYLLGDIRGSIDDLDKASAYMGEKDVTEKINLLLKKANMCLDIESVEEAIDAIEMVEVLNQPKEDLRVSLKLNLLKADRYLVKGNFDKMEYFLEKVSDLLKEVDDLGIEIRSNYLRCRILFNEDKMDEAAELCKETIDRCGDRFIKTKGNTYRILALIYTGLNKFEEAIDLNKKAIELHESIGYTRGVLYALNNTGNIYHDNYQDLEKGLEYYEKILSISKEHKILSVELIALSNIGSLLYESQKYDLAYDYLKESLEKALEGNYKEDIVYIYRMLTILCLDKGDYSNAYKYFILATEKSKGDKRLLDELKIIRGEVYYNLGVFDKALEWTKKGLDNFQERNISARYKYTIRYYLLKIMVEEMKDEDLNICVDKIIAVSRRIAMPQVKIKELSKIAESLYRKGDEDKAKKIFIELERSIYENIHEEERGYYNYIKGILSKGPDKIESLMVALKLAKFNKNKLLTGNTKIEIGNYYYDKKDYYRALNYYVGAAEILRSIIYAVPDRYKLDFVNNYYYIKFIYKLSNLIDMLLNDREYISEDKEKTQADSLEELSILLSADYNVLAWNKGFIDRYRENCLSEGEMRALKTEKVIEALDNDLIENMEIILKYLSDITLATKAQVVLQEDENLSVIACVSEDCISMQNRYIFDKLKTSKEPILISSKMVLNEYGANLLDGDLKAGMYIPIASGYSKLYMNKDKEQYKKNLKILGYIYLETKNTINNFNEEALSENMGFVNLMAILCKKHKLIRMATIDKLTGALTRKFFEDEMQETVKSAKANDSEFSIIMYDLDRFKRVNDKFGHQAGDEVLRKVSKLVIDNIDKKSSIGRYGGEEFVIILPETSAGEALKIADDLREKIENAKILGELHSITISSGVASYPVHGSTSHQLIEKADQALYNAKENGRNKSVVWNKKITDKKPVSKIDRILTGEDVIDSRNMLAIVEIMDLMNSSIDKEMKIDLYLDRLIETLDADWGCLLLIDDEKIVKSYEKKARQEKRIDYFFYDKTIVEDIINSKQGIYTIDWSDMRISSTEAGVPIWSSILAVPIIRHDKIKGIIYLIDSSNSKEFGASDFNFANIYSNLLHV